MAEKMTANEFRIFATPILKRISSFFVDFYEGRNNDPPFMQIIIENQKSLIKHLEKHEEAEKEKKQELKEIEKLRKSNRFKILLMILTWILSAGGGYLLASIL